MRIINRTYPNHFQSHFSDCLEVSIPYKSTIGIIYYNELMTKPKAKKATIQKKKGTLDQKHTEQLNKFQKMSTSLPQKKNKLKKLESELEDLKDMSPSKSTDEDLNRKSYLANTIEKLRDEIDKIENCTDSLNYIVATLPILVDYYDNDEIIDDGLEEEVNNNNNTGKKDILSYFINENSKAKAAEAQAKIAINKKTDEVSTKEEITVTKLIASDEEDEKERERLSKAKLYDHYLFAVDTNHRKNSKKKNNKCPQEGCAGNKTESKYDGSLVCDTCGYSEPTLVITDKPSYKESAQDSGTYAYKRINHLTEILSQLQAKESTDIPPKVFESILKEIKKRKINKNDLDIFKLRRILKKLDYRRYYEHVPHILQIINGKEPPNFSRRDEMRIKKMFKDIQKPFAIYCPKHRKNFLNYSYVLHKFCELLDLDGYISYFPLLKNTGKLRQHDQIWKNICAYMRWEFYKSI